MIQASIFTPSDSVTIQTPAGAVALTYALPPPDPSNPDLCITPQGCAVLLAFAAGAVVSEDMPGCLVVKAGGTAMLTADATLRAQPRAMALAHVVQPFGRYGSPDWMDGFAAAAAAATECSLVTNPAGGTVTIARGKAAAQTAF